MVPFDLDGFSVSIVTIMTIFKKTATVICVLSINVKLYFKKKINDYFRPKRQDTEESN